MSFKNFCQSNPKEAFQKNRYELAVSHYNKGEYTKALDLFSVAYKMNPENQFGKQSIEKIDILKSILRKDFLNKILGVWYFSGEKPTWAVKEDDHTTFTKLMEVSEDKIAFYEEDKKTKAKKLIKSEDLIFYDKNKLNSLFSAIILSNGDIWLCTLSEDAKILHAVNIASDNQDGVKKIDIDNQERFYTKVL
ncbi:tetratricopeptide repeat protein [Flavobacterium sp. 1355]|uniref:tetratricopeptide repeat protein n=1 Tax=Flavobacterium sp. 1355 TaxID=2806571 RepID=UPI001B57F295|nr:tetratricopeptide repeat protein [Flavobacterium sp. 1355]MBP1223803.1 tetratricopeptide (TPR) repeat protein [Flavobacterium sp. 1355]